MPPFSFTHLKYAAEASAEAEKSSGPVLPTTAPSWMASPVAFLPLFMPQLGLLSANAAPVAKVAAMAMAVDAKIWVEFFMQLSPNSYVDGKVSNANEGSYQASGAMLRPPCKHSSSR